MKKAFWLATAATFTMVAAPAWAQDTGTTDTTEEAPPEDDVIIVTAQGRAQQLQDVPLAISAVSAETLQNSGANDIRQLNQVAPSLLVSSTGTEANASPRIRGIGTVGDNPGLESSVAVFIDGVYRSRAGAGMNELGEIERVEVQRGPQGTLGGRNASAGMLSIVTKKPNFNGFSGTGEVTYGNYDYWRVSAGLNIPMGDTIAARVDGVWVKRDGFYKDVVNNTRVNNRDRFFVRGQVLFEPSSEVSFRLVGDMTSRDESCCAATYVRKNEVPQVGGLLDPTQNNIVKVLIDLGQNPLAFSSDPYNRNIWVSPGRSYAGKTKEWGLSGELNWDLGGAKLTSITAYRDYKSNQGSDTDYSQVDILYRAPGNSAYNRQFKTFSQEIRLQGNAFNDRLDWLVGGYFASEKLTLTENLKFGSRYGRFAACRLVSGSTLAGFYDHTNSICINPLAQPLVFGSFGLAGPAFQSAFNSLGSISQMGANNDVYRQKSTNFAFFTHNIVHVTDTVDLTVGLRWTNEKKNFSASFNNNNTACPAIISNVGSFLTSSSATLRGVAGALIGLGCQGNSTSELNGQTITSKLKEDQLTGTAILSWKPNSDTLFYASYAKGYKAGGFNLDRSALKSPIQLVGGVPTATFAAAGGAQALAGNLRFAPETVSAFEIGAKFTFRKFTLNIAAFRQDFKNFQLNTFNGSNFIVQNINGCSNLVGGVNADIDQSKFTGGANYNATAGATGSCASGDVKSGVRSQGVELEANLAPSPYFNVSAGFTYADTKYSNDLVGNSAGIPLDQALRMLPGNNLSNAPKMVVTSAVTWTPPIGSSGLTGLVYVDSRLTSDYNTGSDLFPQKAQDSFALFNARIGIRGPDDRWAIELWGQNIFNQDYAQVAFNSPFQEGATSTTAAFADPGFPGGRQIFSQFLAEPRTYGITIRGKF